ncbi:MAG TPA: type II toxin-antitoxin system PemK/MazF family toxin [Pyrinomonadaceae bacterium]|nr:type II toxin-antitoxin system PemK/MazF family toxin [Pyrinomonadaceae bacterium]
MSTTRWSVWLASLDPVVGSEQGKTRPILVISETSLNNVLPVVNVLPITSRKSGRRIYPNEVLLPAGAAGLTAESIALCYQIRTLDKRRLLRMFGTLDDLSLREAILDALRFQLGIS